MKKLFESNFILIILKIIFKNINLLINIIKFYYQLKCYNSYNLLNIIYKDYTLYQVKYKFIYIKLPYPISYFPFPISYFPLTNYKINKNKITIYF